MGAVKENKVHSLPEYLAIVENAQARASQSIWYRGCGSSAYVLLPSLYRHESLKTPDRLADLERQLQPSKTDVAADWRLKHRGCANVCLRSGETRGSNFEK